MTRLSSSYLLTAFILSIFFLISCSDTNQLQNTTVVAPELLDRSEKIQLGKEWDYVQNLYSDKVKSLQATPDNHEAKLVLAQLFIKEARVTGEHGHYYPAALQMVNQVLNDEALDKNTKFLALMHKAGVQLSLHEFADALETSEKAIVLNPRNAQIHGVLVDCQVELGNYAKAIEIADKMVAMKPDLRSYSRVSYLREIHGDVTGAIDALTLAVEAGYPGYEETAWAMQTLGELYQRYGQNDNAQKIFENILAMRPNYPFAVASLADLQILNGDQAGAEETLNNAIAIIPEVGFYVSLAHILKDQGRDSELEKIKSEIIEMLEDDVVNGHNMNLEYADLYLSLYNDPQTALSYIEKEYQKRPNNIDVNRKLAQVYHQLDLMEDSKQYIAAASITNSAHPELQELKSVVN